MGGRIRGSRAVSGRSVRSVRLGRLGEIERLVPEEAAVSGGGDDPLDFDEDVADLAVVLLKRVFHEGLLIWPERIPHVGKLGIAVKDAAVQVEPGRPAT